MADHFIKLLAQDFPYPSTNSKPSAMVWASVERQGKKPEQVRVPNSAGTGRDDNCRVRKGHAPQNLSALRKFALSLLRQDKQYPKRSLRGRCKTADRIPDYRASLLGLVPLG